MNNANKYCMKKVVITGCTGTIGVALVNHLTEAGVTCVLLNPARFVNENAYVRRELLTFVDCSLDQYKEFALREDLPKDCDAFIHLAWMGTIGPGRDDVDLQIQNIQGAMDALDLAKAMGCKSFLGAGSQAEYGRGVELEERPFMPTTGYGMAKLAAEQLGKLKAGKIGIRFNWVRIFSVYGPNSSPESLTQYVVTSLLNHVSPQLTPCEQIWDFLYTEDAVKALAYIADKGQDGKVYELGSGQTGTIRSFLEGVPALLGIDVPIQFGAKPYPPNQVMKMCAHVDDLKKDTGWEPTHSFDEGILAIAYSLGYQPKGGKQ